MHILGMARGSSANLRAPGRRPKYAPRLLLAAAVMLLVMPAVANAAWSRPRNVEEPGWYPTGAVDIAMARDGAALLAWTGYRSGEVQRVARVRRISPTGRLGPIRTLSNDSSSPVLLAAAVDDDGNALVAWDFFDEGDNTGHVWARRMSRDGVKGPMLRLNEGIENGSDPTVALTPTGVGAINYNDGASRQLVLISRDNRVSEPIQMWGSEMVATRRGDFLIAGQVSADGFREVELTRLRPDGRLVRRIVSADTPRPAKGPYTIGADREGNAYVVYGAENHDDVLDPVLWGRRWSSNGRLGPARRLSPRGHRPIRVNAQTDMQGDTIISWSHPVAPYRLRLYSRIWRRDGSVGPVYTLGAIQTNDVLYPVPSPLPGLALDDDGNGVVVWPEEPESTHIIAWSRRIHRDGTVGPKVMLRDMAEPTKPAITPNGRARVPLWRRDFVGLLLTTGP